MQMKSMAMALAALGIGLFVGHTVATQAQAQTSNVPRVVGYTGNVILIQRPDGRLRRCSYFAPAMGGWTCETLPAIPDADRR